MTPKEIQSALNVFAAEIGADAKINVYLTDLGDPPLRAHVYPNGYLGTGRAACQVAVDRWEDLLPALRAAWAEHAESHAGEITRKMALAIIRATADQGACTDAALRADGFHQRDVDLYGSAACADADDIAGNGPFAIDVIAGANAA